MALLEKPRFLALLGMTDDKNAHSSHLVSTAPAKIYVEEKSTAPTIPQFEVTKCDLKSLNRRVVALHNQLLGDAARFGESRCGFAVNLCWQVFLNLRQLFVK